MRFKGPMLAMYRSIWGGSTNMLGVTPYRDILCLHSSTALSKPICSFWAMPYSMISCCMAVLMLRLGRRFFDLS